ncbi:MAG: restriction endonuclease [Armatimonadetes bacterium]|nr:restriction endonuclease [Armatimonadota bacterium]
MAVPPFHMFMRPALVALSDGKARHWREVMEQCCTALALTEADRQETDRSGNSRRIASRTQWALTYLRQARLIQPAGRAVSAISPSGMEYLREAPNPIRPSDLECFPEFADFRKRERPVQATGATVGTELPTADLSPQELMADAFAGHTQQLAAEVLQQVQSMDPAAFERLIVKLMLTLGYGGLGDDSGRVLGRSGDGGVDGVISLDRLGLERIYLQAKRWSGSTVGSKEIQAFVGALTGQGAQKGVFITTSRFSAEARDYQARLSSPKVSLIDGIELARLMVEHELGVSVVEQYRVKRVDSDFFAEM